MSGLVKKAPKDDVEFLPNARRIAAAMLDYKAKNIKGFDLRSLSEICLAVFVPMVPLVLVSVPIEELMKRIGDVFMGRITG